MHLLGLLLVILAGLLAYYKFGSIASVNGKRISRLTYIKSSIKASGAQVLDQMITESLIENEAKKQNITIDKATIDAEVKAIDEKIVAQGSTLVEALKAREMTMADLESQIKMQKLVEKLSGANKEITQAQIDEFLKTNKAQLPKGVSKDELQKMAKEELASQASNDAINTWLEKVKKEAKIVYN